MSHRKTTEQFIGEARIIHGDRYDYSLTNYTTNKSNVVIVCPLHGQFSQCAITHLRGHGCRQCIDFSYRNLSHEEYISRVVKEHEGRYDYTKTEYVDLTTPITVTCSRHGDFSVSAHHHLYSGSGCHECARNGADQFVTAATLIHGDKYDYVGVKYKDTNTPITIQCPTHGPFTRTPNGHLRGSGCPKCTKKQRHDDFISRAIAVHGARYDYTNTTFNGMNRDIVVRCHLHGDYSVLAATHICGHDCPQCAARNISKIASAWLDSVGLPNTKDYREVTLHLGDQTIKADGFDKSTNTVYEFWGDFWHGNPAVYPPDAVNRVIKKTFGELYALTVRKRQSIIAAGYALVDIWERDWDETKSCSHP